MELLPPFRPGDPVPLFRAAASNGSADYDFGGVAGRYVVLAFLGSAAQEPVRRALAALRRQRRLFDDVRASFFGVSVDPADEAGGRLKERVPGIRFFWDRDGAISRRFGALAEAPDGPPVYRCSWLVLDPMLRVLCAAPLAEAERVLALVAELPPPEAHAGCRLHAPVLVLPRVFEPEFCRRLIELHERHGGQDSGFMREVGGKTVTVLDHGFKRRADHHLEDPVVREAARERLERRVVPALEQAFQFRATRLERYLVACYDGARGGHFRAHRDNTTKGTAHRRFAVTINLNAGEFEGGELCFPEFGPRPCRAPTGAAVVFSCSLLHEARPVTAGRRYAFLPFLYDEAAARIRRANNAHLGAGVGAYRGKEGLAAAPE
jgi:predicted 2-oxoglutarate/Fe(II)-dependent dioxygenase YbiX/peroxiredoxin